LKNFNEIQKQIKVKYACFPVHQADDLMKASQSKSVVSKCIEQISFLYKKSEDISTSLNAQIQTLRKQNAKNVRFSWSLNFSLGNDDIATVTRERKAVLDAGVVGIAERTAA
jgi:hypothetical protein